MATFFCESIGDRGQLNCMITRFDSTSHPGRIERWTYRYDPFAICNEPFSFGSVLPFASFNLPFFLDSIWQSLALVSYGWRSKRPGEIAMPSFAYGIDRGCRTPGRARADHCPPELVLVHHRRGIQATIALSFGRIRKRLSASHQGRFGSANRGEIGFHSVILDLLDQPRAKLIIGDRLATDDPIGKF